MQAMNCETVQDLLARYASGELSPKQSADIKGHLDDCADCREALLFHRHLDGRLGGVPVPPDILREMVLRTIETAPRRRPLLTRLFGDPLMKRIMISTTAVTVCAAAALVVLPRTADATTPAATLKAMRAALAGAVQTGELTLSASVSAEGKVTVSGTLDGQPLPPDVPLHVEVQHTGKLYDIKITAEFAPENYSTVRFGKDHSTLELIPKGTPDHKFEVALDPKTQKPKSWTCFDRVGGAWKAVGHYSYQPKAADKSSVDDSKPIMAHVKILVNPGQNASIRMTQKS